MEGTVLSLGSVNADFQMRITAPPGSAAMLLAHDMWRLGGGKAANIAYLARLLGREAVLLGRVGNDELAEQALAPLRRAGVDLTAVHHAQGATGVAVVLVPSSGKKQIVLAENANDGWSEEELAAIAWRITHTTAPAILVADYEVPAAAVARAVQVACGRGLPVVIDPAFPERAERDVLALADALTPNESEARKLAGIGQEASLEAVAGALQATLRPPLLCIKLEGGGCLLSWQGGLRHIPSAAEEVVDSTGAGDAFTGALAVALLEGQAPPDAAVFAVAAADLAVAAYGAQPSYARRARTDAQAAAIRARLAHSG